MPSDKSERWGYKIVLSVYTTDEQDSNKIMNWLADGLEPFDGDGIEFAGMGVEEVFDEPVDQVGT